MENQATQLPNAYPQWSNRILILSLMGILYLTLFPFRLNFTALQFFQRSPFLLGASSKSIRSLDFVLNVLLFVPFGFGMTAQLRKRGASQAMAMMGAFIAGAFTSYCVELLQFYIPTRSSGWDDVLSNSLGAVVGFVLFDRFGDMVRQLLSKCEAALDTWLSVPRTWVMLLIYLGFFFGISIPLQKETRLSDWDASFPLFIGGDATGEHAWKGQISRFQIWNRALPEPLAKKLTAGESAPDAETGLLAAYEFTSGAPFGPPFEDKRKFLPSLNWMASQPPVPESRSPQLNGNSWLGSKIPVTNLTAELEKTNQFSLQVVCASAEGLDADQRIVSISGLTGLQNLTLRRDGASLVFWFRNPISLGRDELPWYAEGVFEPRQLRNIIVSYDGADLSLYVDGKKSPQVYYLSPGAALAREFQHLNTSELDGYLATYDALMFIPAGLLFGVIARKSSLPSAPLKFLAFLILLVPAILLEFILVRVSGRAISIWQLGLCCFLTMLGAWLVNADRSAANHGAADRLHAR